ncbi:MAG: DUF4082 domain-containing protein [Chitinophagaceae bacterium]|nr:DUF4082 domain-containing protein [Chitinophagaceae bacterium]
MKKIFAVTIVLASVLWSCKKDQPEVSKPETPGKSVKVLKNLLEHNEIVDTVLIANVNEFEVGMRFYSSTSGKITHLGCKMPSAGKYKVSLWDYGSKQLLASAVLDNYPDQFTYADITDIPAIANQRFVISIHTVVEGAKRPYYISRKKSSSASVYPFTAGNIVFEALHSKVSPVSVFPDAITQSNQSLVAGYPDIIFQ